MHHNRALIWFRIILRLADAYPGNRLRIGLAQQLL